MGVRPGSSPTRRGRPRPGGVVASFRAGDPHPRAVDGVYSVPDERRRVDRRPRREAPPLSRDDDDHGRHVPCGVRLRWDALAGRSTTWTLCMRGGSSTCAAWTRSTPSSARPTGRATHARRRRTAASAVARRTARKPDGSRPPARVSVTVGGVRLQAIRLHMNADVSGASSGTETVDWWLDPRTALPLSSPSRAARAARSRSIGRAHYREDATLRLVSTTPQR